MKATFIVTIEGDWLDGDKRVTTSQAGKELRQAVKQQFQYLAKRTKVKQVKIDKVAATSAVDLWQPIETAPKDGSTLLLGRFNGMGNWCTMRGQWTSQAQIDNDWEDPDGHEEGWYETAVEPDAPNCWSIYPTHWQPLPVRPTAAKGTAGQDGAA